MLRTKTYLTMALRDIHEGHLGIWSDGDGILTNRHIPGGLSVWKSLQAQALVEEGPTRRFILSDKGRLLLESYSNPEE